MNKADALIDLMVKNDTLEENVSANFCLSFDKDSFNSTNVFSSGLREKHHNKSLKVG